MKIRRMVPLAVMLFSAGCGTVPGMQMDVHSMNDGESTPSTNAEIFPISPSTIKRLADERAASKVSTRVTSAIGPVDSYQYIVGPEDVLRVTVWDHPELNNPGAITGAPNSLDGGLPTSATAILGTANDSTARVVSDDGTMFYPYIGVVQVSGKTPEQIRAFLQRELAKSIRNPQVEVVVASYRSKRIYVTGEVKTPGAVPVTDIPLTIADAVASVGGLNLDADLSNVILTRRDETRIIDLYRLLYQGDLSQNVTLRSGDVLNVPEQRFNKIFVLGEVVKPAALLMPRGEYSLNEALADAGGASQLTAKASQIYVIRGTPSSPLIFHLDATKPDALVLADGFILMPRDIVFVDAATIVRYNRVISQILPALQALQAGKYLGQ